MGISEQSTLLCEQKLLTSRQIFRYAVPARTVTKKHWVYDSVICCSKSYLIPHASLSKLKRRWLNGRHTYRRVERRIPPISLPGPSYSTRLRPCRTGQGCGSSCRQLHDCRPGTNCHPHKLHLAREAHSLSTSDRAIHSWFCVSFRCIRALLRLLYILHKANDVLPVAQLSQRDRAAEWVSFCQKWKTIFCRHCRSIFNQCDLMGLQSYRSRWNNTK